LVNSTAALVDCQLARSFREALDVAREGAVALARMSFGRWEEEGVFGEELLDWDLEAMFDGFAFVEMRRCMNDMYIDGRGMYVEIYILRLRVWVEQLRIRPNKQTKQFKKVRGVENGVRLAASRYS